jgi:hypothetical protein
MSHTHTHIVCMCVCVCVCIQCVPLANEPGISLIILTAMKILQRNFEQDYVRCVRNEEVYVCSQFQISLQWPH